AVFHFGTTAIAGSPLFQGFHNFRSAEMEHRIILREVLLTLRKRSFTEALLEIPDVGKDEDFERVQNQQKADDVFA
ncbi:MAG: hypothetical protein KDI15_03455, partial [Thiothrix sp.]|nr:hypothetical protein [Thiothrix sp.]